MWWLHCVAAVCVVCRLRQFRTHGGCAANQEVDAWVSPLQHPDAARIELRRGEGRWTRSCNGRRRGSDRVCQAAQCPAPLRQRRATWVCARNRETNPPMSRLRTVATLTIVENRVSGPSSGLASRADRVELEWWGERTGQGEGSVDLWVRTSSRTASRQESLR
jgi:hypothetical protein